MQQLRIAMFVAAVALVAMIVVPSLAVADDEISKFRAKLDGYQEVPQAISTTGRGKFKAKVNDDETAIEFELSYRNLEGVPDSSLRAHIHFGRPGVAGCIVIHLCGSGGKPACPVSSPGSGTLTGTLTAADVVACVTGGIAAGQLSEVIDAMHAHATYVNVHNDTYGSGEIRGAIKGKD